MAPHLLKIGLVGICLFLVGDYAIKRIGTLRDFDHMQSLSPDGKVNAVMYHRGDGLFTHPPYNSLDMQDTDIRFRMSADWKVTQGEFLDLSWSGPKSLVVFGRNLEPSLTRLHMKGHEWKHGIYSVTFININEK